MATVGGAGAPAHNRAIDTAENEAPLGRGTEGPAPLADSLHRGLNTLELYLTAGRGCGASLLQRLQTRVGRVDHHRSRERGGGHESCTDHNTEVGAVN